MRNSDIRHVISVLLLCYHHASMHGQLHTLGTAGSSTFRYRASLLLFEVAGALIVFGVHDCLLSMGF